MATGLIYRRSPVWGHPSPHLCFYQPVWPSHSESLFHPAHRLVGSQNCCWNCLTQNYQKRRLVPVGRRGASRYCCHPEVMQGCQILHPFWARLCLCRQFYCHRQYSGGQKDPLSHHRHPQQARLSYLYFYRLVYPGLWLVLVGYRPD
jgi:hypothetical protein